MSSDVPEIALFLGSFVLFMLVLEVAFRLGFRHRDREGASERTHLASLQTALFGLMSLLLGFDFAMASSRFETRKTLVQDETDAIGNVAMRCQFLQHQDRDEIMAILRPYVASRIAYSQAGDDHQAILAASAESTRLRDHLWESVEGIASRNRESPGYGLLIPALGDMGNAAWKRRAALDNHVPVPVFALLITVASGALGFLAYNYGLTGRRRHISSGIFVVMICSVLATIIDLDQPRSGSIRIGEDSMLRLQNSLETMDR